jgi:hypothetical protein
MRAANTYSLLCLLSLRILVMIIHRMGWVYYRIMGSFTMSSSGVSGPQSHYSVLEFVENGWLLRMLCMDLKP